MYWDPTGHSAEYAVNYNGQQLSSSSANDNMAQREIRKVLNKNIGTPNNPADLARINAGISDPLKKAPTVVYKTVKVEEEVKDEKGSWGTEPIFSEPYMSRSYNNLWNDTRVESFRNFLAPLAAIDRNNTLNMILSAKEPYRTVYMQSLLTDNASWGFFGVSRQNYYIADANYQKTDNFEKSYFGFPGKIWTKSSSTETVFPYSSFFHEWAHAEYELYLGELGGITKEQIEELQSAIKFDVITNLENRVRANYLHTINTSNLSVSSKMAQLSDTKATEDAVQKIVNFMLDPNTSGRDTDNRNGLSVIEAQALDAVIEHYGQAIGGSENSMAADIYGGVTNNFIGGGHQVGYFYRNNQLSYSLSSEFYAEALSTFAVGPKTFLESARKFLPTSTDKFDEIMWTIVQ